MKEIHIDSYSMWDMKEKNIGLAELELENWYREVDV